MHNNIFKKFLVALIVAAISSNTVLAIPLGDGTDQIPAGVKFSIGYSNPSENLTLNGASAFKSLSSAPGATANFGKLYVNGGNLYFKDAAGNATKLNLASGGSVGSGAGSLNNVVEDTSPQLGANLDVQNFEIVSVGANDLKLSPAASRSLIINDAGLDADMRIEGDNNPNLLYVDAGNDRIGIGGTATPTRTLQVNGSLGVRSATQSYMNLERANNTPGFSIGRSVASDDGQNFFIRDDVFATTRFVIDNAGNVGIGTTGPNKKLRVNGDALITGFIESATWNGVTLAVAKGGTGATTAAGARTNLGLVLGTNVQAWDADLDTWATKTAPSGTVVGTSDAQTLSSKTLTAPILGSAVINGLLLTTAGGVITQNGELLWDRTNRRVGIGISPTQKLHVNGNILATGSITGASISAKNLTVNGTAIAAQASDLFKNGGDTAGANRTLGNNDHYSLGFETNGSTAMTITNNGSVGIGTTGPNKKLRVNGDALITGFIESATWNGVTLAVAKGGTGATTAAGARTNLGLVLGTNVQAWDADLDTWATKTAPSGTVVGTSDAQTLSSKTLTAPILGSAVINGLLLTTAGGVITQNGELLWDRTNRRVGIGISPTQKLHVNGNILATGSITGASISAKNLTVNGTAIAAQASDLFKNGGDTAGANRTLGNNDHYSLGFETNGSTAMTITNNGKVGIGTSSPNAQLQVGGASQMSNARISARGDGCAALEFGHGNPNGYGSSIGATEPWGIPYLGFNTEAESAGNTFRTRGIVGRVMYADLAGGVKFARVTNPSAAGQTLTDDMIINSSGNVGIGTTTPSEKLHVAGNILSTGNLSAKSLTVNGSTVASQPADLFKNGGDTAGANRTLGNNDHYALGFETNGSTAMTITNNGRVGIGTTTPQALAHFYTGNAGTDPAWTAMDKVIFENNSAQAIQFFTPNNVGSYIMWSEPGNLDSGYLGYDQSSNGMYLGTSGSDRLAITSSGNVGIGMSATTAKLHVNGNILAVGNLSGKSLTVNGSAIASQASDLFKNGGDTAGANRTLGNNDHYALGFETNGSTAMTITNNGYVGIGTTSPNNKLEVAGGTTHLGSGAWPTVSMNRSNQRVGIFSNAEDGYVFVGNMQTGVGINRGGYLYLGARQTSGINDFAISSVFGGRETATNGDAASYMAFRTSNAGGTPSEKVRITSSGSVGIGTASPESFFHLSTDFSSGVIFSAAANNNSGMHSYFRKARGTHSAPIIVNADDILGQDLFMGHDGTAWQNSAMISVSVDGTPGAGDMPGRIQFHTSADGTTALAERMRITNAGNVGIGTTTPATRLDIADARGSGHVFTVTNTSATAGYSGSVNVVAPNLAAGERVFFNLGKAGSNYNRGNMTYTYVGNSDTSNRLSFGFYGADDLLNILASGSVGIGTSTPNAQLQVGGSSQMSNAIISARGAGRAALEFGHGNPNGYGSSIGATEPSGMPYLGFNTEAESAGNTFITRGMVGRVMYADLTGGVKFARVTNPSAAGQTLTDDMIINSSGNVGIGTTTPGRKLFVNGDAGGTTAWFNDSDERLKQNIHTIDNALDKVTKLRGVYYKWKDTTNHPAGQQMGLIAQEVKEVVPEVVGETNGYYSLATPNLVGLLVESVKELKAENDALKALVCKDHPEASICQEKK
jgi:hypothetical protein